jgi:hypothetical protein
MRVYKELTIEQEMEIFGTLEMENWTPLESAKYVNFIRKIAKIVKMSVYFVWQTQRKYAKATVNDVIKTFQKL